MSMQKSNTILNESTKDCVSLLPSSSTPTVVKQTEQTINNMEETSTSVSADDPIKCQSENVSNDQCERNNQTTSDSKAEPKPEPEPQLQLQSKSPSQTKTKTENETETKTKSMPESSNTVNKPDSQGNSDSLVTVTTSHDQQRKKVGLLRAPMVETICDDISITTEEIKRLKHVQVRSNSTGKLYQSSRRVSFPENDSELVTGYLEPADPWACGK